jgi:cytochrome b561
MEPITLTRQWLLSWLLGSALYAAYQGTVHFSDWCYLGVATFFAAGVSLLMLPLNRLLLRQLARRGPVWPVAGRWIWLLGGTAALFGLANVLVLPLLSWLGPLSSWPWGVAALPVALFVNRNLL